MRKVHTLDQRIHGRYELRTWRTSEERCVVPNTYIHIRSHRAGFAEIPLNQRELRQGHANFSVRAAAERAPPDQGLR